MNPLAVERFGDGSKNLVFLHGFTQTGRAWREIANELVRLLPDVCCIAVDLPGHGGSSEVVADLRQTAEFVAQEYGPASFVGYSLGARITLQLLVDHPSLVHRAMIISGNAGIEDAAQRAARAQADDLLADRISRIGVETFIEEWLAQPLFSDLTSDRAMVVDRHRNTAAGLAMSLRTFGQGRQAPIWAQLASSAIPILAVAGSRDTKYVELARRIAATAPRGSLRIIPDAGHSAALEKPVLITELIYDWMTNPNAYNMPTTT